MDELEAFAPVDCGAEALEALGCLLAGCCFCCFVADFFFEAAEFGCTGSSTSTEISRNRLAFFAGVLEDFFAASRSSALASRWRKSFFSAPGMGEQPRASARRRK